MVLLAPSKDDSKVRVAGPQDARPVRELPAGRILDLLEASRSMATREAASFLTVKGGVQAGRRNSRGPSACLSAEVTRLIVIIR